MNEADVDLEIIEIKEVVSDEGGFSDEIGVDDEISSELTAKGSCEVSKFT